MADNTIKVRMKDRTDTEANWTSKNPILLKGERAITEGTGKYKIGDGSTRWTDLPYYEAMTSADRTKLNGIASGANKTTVDSALSSTSTNPVQNKVVNSALAGKSNTNHTHDLSTMINTLSTGDSTPTDNDYFVSQYAGGGTTTTTYYRRPVKALLEYIRGKLAKVATSGSYNDLSDKPTIPSVGNGTITIKQAGAVKGTFTTNQSGATTIELTDNNTNTWRGIQDNLTSTAADQSLSAKQGKWLNENKTDIREWNALIKCATWSRLCYVAKKVDTVGSSFILNIAGTRKCVVYNDTFVIKVHHSSKATISKISGSTYSTGIQIRVASDSIGNCYVEMYENVNGATNTTTQTVYCSLIDIACGAITSYTAFTDGTTLPSGFTSNATMTTNSNSLQGNLTWNEVTGKPAFKTVATSGSYNDLSNKPTIGNGTITVTQGGATKGTFALNQTGNTTIALTDNNTWRGIQNNLTSTATDQSLSAAQGKLLNESKLMHKSITTEKTDLNSLTETGIYHIKITSAVNAPTTNHATLIVDSEVGTKYQIFLPDTDATAYKRTYNNSNNVWNGWNQLKFTDTIYTHPSYTAKSNGLYKVTVDSTGHVSGTTAVAKSDITSLGIPSTNTTYSTGTTSTSGLTKLYTGTGTATDGTMTQAAIKSVLDGKSNNGHTHDDRYYTESEMNTKLSGKSDTSHTHNRIVSRGDVTAETGAGGRPAVEGLSMSQVYNNGYPTSYGNVINLRGTGDGQILVGWSGSDKGYAPVYVRNKRDNTTTADWSSWQQFYTTGYKPTKVDVGLGNVDNTADSAKSVKYATSAGSASTATKATTADSANAVAWGNVTGKPSTFTPASHTHNYAGSSSAGGAANSANVLNNYFSTRQTSADVNLANAAYANKLTFMLATSTMTTSEPPSDGLMLNFGWDSRGYGAQMSIGNGKANHLYIRGADTNNGASSYGDWKTILDSSNYNSYAPTKTGGGASGTWGINVTGNAATATKLGTSAGSASQPVYFSDGKPVACSYTINASVPSGAKFTDTNTWRGIQNNLTSTSTTDSLSAAQGKVLNDKFASYVPTSRTVNGKALNGNISLSAGDVGASASNHNHDSTYLKLSGGTLSGRVVRSGGGSWITDRDNVAIFGSASSKDAYNPVVGQKTPSGAWTIGNLANSENLIFNYTSDANYSSKNNTCTQVSLPNKTGTIITSATIGSQSVKYSTTSGSATNASKVNNHTVNSDVPSGAKFTDTVYSHPTSSGNKHIPSGGSSGQILRWSADGTAVWGADNNTTYSDATTSAHGLMTAAMVTKLNGIATNANNYSLPTASSSTLGGVKTTSTVTSTSGLTACPIISGVPYYKDTNTTYTLSSITGTLAVAKGGTGSTTAAGGRAGLGAVGFVCQKTEPSGQNNGDLWFAEE